MNEKFDVTGMSCSACSSHVEKSVSKLEGIKTVSVNLLTNSMQVEYDETKLDTGKIIEAVEHAVWERTSSMRSAHTDTGSRSDVERRSMWNRCMRWKKYYLQRMS